MGAAGPPGAVRFGAVVRRFGKVTAVDGLDLELPPGRPVALLGRNGAGKSTTLSLLLGLDRPDAGEVRVFGRAPGRAVRDGLVGAMLQDAGGVSRVTVREVVAMAAAAAPRPGTPPAPCCTGSRASGPWSSSNTTWTSCG
ncbi:ATP-binding cassette domain-containing protein, partial [Streptomyces albidoflavus]